MNVKLNKLINSMEALKELSGLKLPAKTAYNVARIISRVDSELATFNECRTKAIESLGTITEDGNHYNFTPENSVEFEKQMIELSDVDVEIDRQIITVEMLGDVVIEPSMLIALDWIISE